MSVSINVRDLLEAGVHFGHQTQRWNPKMKPYIFSARNGIHVIDLMKTVRLLQKACQFLEGVTAKKGHVLFVGTKRHARDVIMEQAERSHSYYINSRWLGGTLTNFQTIRKSIHRLKRIEKMSEDGTFDKLVKKEVLNLERKLQKLNTCFSGIKDMPGIPSAVFIVDAHKESIAVKEAHKLGIPIVAVTDTNTDPTLIDYVVPGNDDSSKSIRIFVTAIAEACLSGNVKSSHYVESVIKKEGVHEGSFYDEQGNTVTVEKRAKKSDSKNENQT